MLGAGWVIFFELAKYLAFYLLLGGQNAGWGFVLLYGFIPLVYFVSGLTVSGAFGDHPYRWLLIAAGITLVVQSVFVVIQVAQFPGARLSAQLFVTLLVQQLLCAPFALLGARVRRSRSRSAGS
ncbi:MAG: hypothetical protein WAL91_06860 [Propionicimonas sp.]